MALAEYIYFMGFKLDWASDPDQSSASEPDQENILVMLIKNIHMYIHICYKG